MFFNFVTGIFFGFFFSVCLRVAAGQQTRLSYEELQRQNDLLSGEISSLLSRVRYLTSECTCANQIQCEYRGRRYDYRSVWRGGACERCSCEENGQVLCRVDDTIPGCGDQCLSSPCYNGGTCQGQGPTSFVCVCPTGCTGRQCEKREAHTCSLPPDLGRVCDMETAAIAMFYFEPRLDECIEAMYSGCGGNKNRFPSYEACKQACVRGTCCTRHRLRYDVTYGHSVTGYDRYGFKQCKDEQGRTASVQTATAFGQLRYRYQGVDYKGYRSDGFNKDRYSRYGYNCEGVDDKALNEDGLSSGFNYTCDQITKSQCMDKVNTRDFASEVVSFSAGETECQESSCHDGSRCRGCVYNGQFYRYEESFNNGCNRCTCTRFGSVQCTCSKVTQRKEVRDMTATEIANYQKAIRKMYAQGKWTEFSEMYEKYLPHSHSNGLNFLTWHRAMLNQLEIMLQTASGSCDLTIPYFDWTMDVGTLLMSPIWRAGLFGGNGGNPTQCVKHHPFVDRVPWSPCLRRALNSDEALPLPDAVTVERIKRSDDFSSLNHQLVSVSLLFRLWVGGHAQTRNAIYDPIVVSHYAFIDRIFHDWQQRGDNYLNLDPRTRYRPLAPFGLSPDDMNSSPKQLCVEYAPLNSLCTSDMNTAGRSYNLADPQAFDANGFDSAGFDRLGFNRQGFNGDGFDKDGYDIRGYDRYGFNREGASSLGFTRTGGTLAHFDVSVFDKQNFTRLGLDVTGLDFEGRDIFGYDSRFQDSDGCNGHSRDGYFYVKQKYEFDLDLCVLIQTKLDRISRLCATLSSPPPSIYIASWVVVDPTHTLRTNPLATAIPQQIPEANIWIPSGPDARFCVDIHIYSSCGLGEVPKQTSCTADLCRNAECPGYGTDRATCRMVGCDNECRKEWYHNGIAITSSCVGCRDVSTGRSYTEGERWMTSDDCSSCQCVAGVNRCSGCPRITCANPDSSSCCPVCSGCTYHNTTYSDQATFTPSSRPCDQCQCRAGTVLCATRRCPQVLGCRDPVTLVGTCCAICLSCGNRQNGETWREDECTSCKCEDGRTRCNRVDCGAARCSHPVRVRGVCCPQCQACSYRGAYYRDGQTFLPDDCQSCTCNRGNVVCSPVTCPPTDCDNPFRALGECCPTCREGCEYSGEHYDDGEVFTPSFNPCMNCTCQDNKIRCGRARCPPSPELSCSRPIALPGECCPSFCPSCVFEGEEYSHTDSWRPTSRPCEVCICYSGIVSCRSISRCSQTCSYGVFQEGECCSPCTDCNLNGEIHTDGTSFAQVTDQGCSECVCTGGNIQCSSPAESCPRSDCSNPIQIPNTCCARCPSCSNGKSHGDRWRDQEDQCRICECKDGAVTCSRQPCPRLAEGCVTMHTPEEQCCPSCMDCITESGSLHVNGTSSAMVGDPCSSCVCLNQELTCGRDPCPLSTGCPSPVMLSGSCCPVCDRCRAANGSVYMEGESYIPDNDPCLTCTCTNSVISCVRAQCPALACQDPVPVPGKCCPICVNRRCDYRGGELNEGESIAEDCAVCTCIGGKVRCLAETCPPTPCSNPVPGTCCPECTGVIQCVDQLCEEINCANPTKDGCCRTCDKGCEQDNQYYEEGETITINSNGTCSNCTCRQGSVLCTPPVCETLVECPQTYHPDGECCARCSGCFDYRVSTLPSIQGNPPFINNYPESETRRRKRATPKVMADGDTYFDTKTCDTCTCMEGTVSCTPTNECPSVECDNPTTAGCCPSCDGCSYGNVTYLGIYKQMPDPEHSKCGICYCDLGTIRCGYKGCENVKCPSDRVVELDECGCEFCSDKAVCRSETNSSIVYQLSETWINDEFCSCTCELTGIVCEKCEVALSCPFTEADPFSCCGRKCKGCTVDQVHFSSGATWSQDGCQQTCSCHSGVVTCIETLTSVEHCTANPLGCTPCCESSDSCPCSTPDGKQLSTGQSFAYNNADICAVCTCVQNSSTTSTYLECYEPVCPDVSECPEDLLFLPDSSSCCPLCKNYVDFECTVGDEGTTAISKVDPCQECTCTSDTWFCSSKACPDIDCPLSERLTQPGECCSTCAGCYTDSVRKAHGSSWQHDSDPCSTCQCSYGDILCETSVMCPPLFCTEGRKAFTPLGECCAICGDPVTGDDCLDRRGSTRAHGSGWPIDDCTLCECLFGKLNCTTEQCPKLDCKSDETLVIEEGICCPSCVKQPALCKVYGDPHYKTFDGETLHFQGFCSYEMVSDCDSDSFKIVAVHDDRATESVSWIKGVVVEIGSITIRLGQGLWAEVNGVNVTTPFQHQTGIVIRQRTTAIDVIANHLGFKLTWDGSSYGEVEVETHLKNKLCGLCGNFNDDSTDELTLRDGTIVSSHSQFGDSWLVPGSECTAVTADQHPCDIAGYDVKKQAIEQCAIIQMEVFSPCHRAVPPEDYVFSCVYDMCACNSTAECLCDVLTAYSAACQNSYVNIQWRTHDRCALNCDAAKGLLFDECGPVCPRTCANYFRALGDIEEKCLKPCEPSCQCPAGLVQHNGRCITTDLCPP